MPYTMWHPLDAEKTLIRDIALRSYDHVLLAENAVPFPIHVKHGSADGMTVGIYTDLRQRSCLAFQTIG